LDELEIMVFFYKPFALDSMSTGCLKWPSVNILEEDYCVKELLFAS
jgi:hypothetical protein